MIDRVLKLEKELKARGTQVRHLQKMVASLVQSRIFQCQDYPECEGCRQLIDEAKSLGVTI